MTEVEFTIEPLDLADLSQFKHDMQEAFQKGSEAYFGEAQGDVLPESDIDDSLNNPTAQAFQAFLDGKPVGGAIVCFQHGGKIGHLDFLFVKVGTQSRGIGQRTWRAIEARYPDVELWETCTPYFDRRNVHFYINALGFAAVEYFNPRHPDPHDPRGNDTNDSDMFRFEKPMPKAETERKNR